MTCGDCKYSHELNSSTLLCWGQRFAPKVDWDDWCEGWKPRSSTKEGWVKTSDCLPNPFESVQVYIPSQAPFPVVREGYVVDGGDGLPRYFFVPSLRETYDLYDGVKAWKPMAEPPERIL